ncbi:MAG: glycerophosphodiester phosphodiesterase family protein [Gammaproteobacteria bacterium]|nr:glycerophosphodiester phosphodiesterase family protein [Gammaproteobacteria bacterium]
MHAPWPKPQRYDGLWVIGHRGAAGLAPENTLASFSQAVRLGVDAVELDVHLSADERLLVIHDADVERTTNGRGKVATTTFAALRRLDAGDGERIPTLDEVLEAVPTRIAVNIELKGRGTAAPVARAVTGCTRPLLVSAFDHAELARFRDLCPDIPCAPLLAEWRRGVLDTARALDAWSVNLADGIAGTATVNAVRESGRLCLVYTVNDAERAAALRAMGVAGVFGDFPDRLLKPAR